MLILFIDTCTERAAIAYGNQEDLLFAKELPFGLSQAKFLMPYLAEQLRSFGYPPPLDAIGVGIGPGSYTGIRVGVAVAQALAYSWKIPLVGISSLNGFIPSEYPVHFGAILDARIGGIYLQRGWRSAQEVIYQENPRLVSLEESGQYLKEVTHLVTPYAKSLQTKLKLSYPDCEWVWEEKAPCMSALMKRVEEEYQKGKTTIPPRHLELLYLRETEAERKFKSKEV